MSLFWGSAAGAAGRGLFGICPWDAALLVPTLNLEATGSHLGTDATRCNCSPAALKGACLQMVPGLQPRLLGGRQKSLWLDTSLHWHGNSALLSTDASPGPPQKIYTSRVEGGLWWDCLAGLSQELLQQAKHGLLRTPVNGHGAVWLWEMTAELKAFSHACRCSCPGAGGGEGGCCPHASSQQVGICQV